MTHSVCKPFSLTDVTAQALGQRMAVRHKGCEYGGCAVIEALPSVGGYHRFAATCSGCAAVIYFEVTPQSFRPRRFSPADPTRPGIDIGYHHGDTVRDGTREPDPTLSTNGYRRTCCVKDCLRSIVVSVPADLCVVHNNRWRNCGRPDVEDWHEAGGLEKTAWSALRRAEQ